MKVLIVDEWGGFNSIRLTCDFAAAGADVFVLREFSFHVPLPRNATLLPPVSLAPADRLAAIDKAVNELQPDLVMPMDEPTLLNIWDTRPSWLDRIQPQVDLELLPLYRDKRKMEDLARSLDIPLPETFQLESIEELNEKSTRKRIKELGLPVVVKGAGGCMGEQVHIADTLQDAERAIRALYKSTGEMPAVQRFIDGAPYQSGGLFDRGRPIQFLTGEKIAIQPPRTGPAIALKSVAAPELVDYSARFLTALGFSGLAGIDFVADREGRFYFLEVNPRLWGSYGFARALGIDLFRPWCELIQGATLPTNSDYPVNRTWAKMPDYIFADPKTRANMLGRLCRPLSLKSLAWSQPRYLMYQLRRIYWELRK